MPISLSPAKMMRRSPSLNSAIFPTNCSAMLRRLLEGAVSSIVFFWDVRRSSCRGSAIHGHLYSTIGWIQPAASVGRASLSDMGFAQGAGAQSGHLVGQRSDFLDPDLDHIAGLEEFPARCADPGGRAGENEIARVEGRATRQLRDLLGQVEDHMLGVGVLLEDVVNPQLEPEILRVADVVRRHDP